ncbi:peroxidase family protein [Marinimicrococcus flavescens]|uniref:Heme peroxidase family protein n=1 Tax=Marinimicrococcus flavescens TaxID=3031815 RepID=A0AAP3V0A1_9PROT|nr:heme peroxidase family protein [Marinimicrococcus flavescens]
MPTNVSSHGYSPREYQPVPLGTTFEAGRFGRMFPELPALEVADAALEALGTAMKEPDPADPARDNPEVAAGYTYLGQFVDHDITFDPTTVPEMRVDPQAVFNFRTPKLELDSVYLAGPGVSRYLYDATAGTAVRASLLIGRTQPTSSQLPPQFQIAEPLPNDLPRLNKVAVIGDPRNDENLAVAQTHLAFLKFHNKIVGRLAGGVPEDRLFEKAREATTWHYQKIVLTDFLPKLIRPAVLQDVLENGRKFYNLANAEPFIPIEFSVAAYRLGHSMVREAYQWNRVFSSPDQGGLVIASLDLLFRFSELSSAAADTDIPVPSNWPIDWRRFFELGQGPGVNHARRFDPLLIPALHDLRPRPVPATDPAADDSLAVRNLKRGQRMSLPSGQAVACRMGIVPLTPAEINSGRGTPDEAVAAAHGLDRKTPLWYYILKEAHVQEDGLRLGEVGSRILAEVFVGLLEGDANSFLAQNPLWQATMFKDPAHPPADVYTMADLLAFVDDVNPVGEAGAG